MWLPRENEMADLKPGAVLYAKNLGLVSHFYQHVAGLDIVRVEKDHVVLVSKSMELIVLQVPAPLAQTIDVESPPKRRTDTPIKLVFPISSISEARVTAALHQGELDPPEHQWEFQGCLVCDGHDPEGNVIQFRENVI